jgi:hypothetical protein
VGRCTRGKRKKKKKACRPDWLRAENEGRERGGGKGFAFFFNFLSNSFSNIQTSIKQKSMHSNHDAQALIIS